MKTTSIDQDRATIIFHQMGAKVKTIHGVQCYIRFTLDENIELYYVYNITKDNELYLQRIKPYPFGAGVFSSVDEIIRFIELDLSRFNNASNSKVFDDFVFNNQKMNDLIQSVESLFLEKNVPKEKMQEITNLLEQIDQKIIEIYENTPRV
ncbi:MAG: hypothetical protein ACOWWR_07630 [Eubacteriales bacterium]